MEAGTVVSARDVGPGVRVDEVIEEFELIHPAHYAEPMRLSELVLGRGISDIRVDDDHDEFLYVLDGQVDFVRDAAIDSLDAGGAAHVRAGQRYQLRSHDRARVLSFLVPAPGTPWASALERPTLEVVDVARLGAQSSQAATADRQYEVLFDASRGSRGATMFVGFIPTSGAPEHYHLYDEICVIVRGSGTFHARGTDQPIGVGSAFHVAPRLLHALENPNPEDLWVLGVFRPEGSAAAAFYPDGTPAPNNEE